MSPAKPEPAEIKLKATSALLETMCKCDHTWKWHIYGTGLCVIKDCSCKEFQP